MVEPLTIVPPSKPNKKTDVKSTSRKKKTVKKGESKVALSMTDLYKKGNPFKAAEEGSTAQAARNANDGDASKMSSDVATPGCAKGKPDSTLISDDLVSGRKLGLEHLNDAIEITENMDVSNPDNETGIDDSVENIPKETDGQDNVGPDVSTYLGQLVNLTGDEDVIPIVETNLEEDVNPDNIVENSHTEVSGRSDGDSEKDEEEVDSESDKDVVDVDELDLDDVPLAQTIGDSVAKRLRSNKGKVVPSTRKSSKKTATDVAETPKSRRKTAGVGPKKSWSKVMVKNVDGISRKRKVVSSSDYEYDVEMDALNIIPSESKKSAKKKDMQIVEDVLVDKVSFHFPNFAQRWKFIYHRRLALERELSEEALKIEEVMKLIGEAGLEKLVCKLGECYEKLVREFLVNIPKDCDNPLKREYQKVYVRGECVNFSPNIINNFLGIDEGGVVEVEAIDNQICQEITANQVKVWPKKGKISSRKLSIKYVVLNRTGAANWVPTTHSSDIATSLARFIYVVGTKTKMDIGRYVFDQTMRHAKTDAVKLPIAFPTLLCKIMLS